MRGWSCTPSDGEPRAPRRGRAQPRGPSASAARAGMLLRHGWRPTGVLACLHLGERASESTTPNRWTELPLPIPHQSQPPRGLCPTGNLPGGCWARRRGRRGDWEGSGPFEFDARRRRRRRLRRCAVGLKRPTRQGGNSSGGYGAGAPRACAGRCHRTATACGVLCEGARGAQQY